MEVKGTWTERSSVALFALTLMGACSADNEEGLGTEMLGTAGLGNSAGTGVDSGGSSGGIVGSSGSTSSGGVTGSSGMPPGTGGLDASAGSAGRPGNDTSSGGAPVISGGDCCPDGNCLCHGPAPSELTATNGSFRTDSYRGSTGTIYYPTDAEPPFAGVALCGGFTNTGPEMAGWGTFYASHGIVTLITTTGGLDFPDLRGTKLLASIEELKAENTKSGGQLSGKMAGRYGTSGYSMGGGGTTLASREDSTLSTSVGLAAWGPNGSGVQVPTLLLCGGADLVAPCSGSQGAYDAIPEATPKMLLSIAGVGHLSWFGPRDAGGGQSGEAALAFQKVFLEGDTRWASLLNGARGMKTTNIQ